MADDRTIADRYVLADPSPLTAAQVLREIAALEKQFTIRLDAMDKAVQLFSDNLVRVPTDVDKQVANLRAYQDEKLKGVGGIIEERFNTILERFRVVDQRFQGITDQFGLNDKALIAALAAAKDAVGENTKWFKDTSEKSEKSTADQIKTQRDLLTNNYQALRDLVAAIDTRLTRFEGLGLGTAAAQTTQRQDTAQHQTSSSFTLSLAVAGMSFIFGLVAIIFEVVRAHP